MRAPQGSEKNAVVVFVATETERQASWSRLDGLILHWACGTEAGGAWSMPPEGWSAVPSKTKDAGGSVVGVLWGARALVLPVEASSNKPCAYPMVCPVRPPRRRRVAVPV